MKRTLNLAAAFVSLSVLAAGSVAIGQDLNPQLPPNVKRAPGYEAVAGRLVAANPTPIFTDLNVASPPNGELKLGEPVQALAKVRGWDWILVGKDGKPVGYVPRALLKPADS
jgi:hypothetical protein